MAISQRKRFDILQRDRFTCQYCGGTPPLAILQVDHILAVANGGGDEPENLRTACRDCNLGKRHYALMPGRVGRFITHTQDLIILDSIKRESRIRHEVMGAPNPDNWDSDRVRDESFLVDELSPIMEPAFPKDFLNKLSIVKPYRLNFDWEEAAHDLPWAELSEEAVDWRNIPF